MLKNQQKRTHEDVVICDWCLDSAGFKRQYEGIDLHFNCMKTALSQALLISQDARKMPESICNGCSITFLVKDLSDSGRCKQCEIDHSEWLKSIVK